ncbi:HAD family hydrolase [Pseudophaeobacter sp.]|uniref:HAD family hydrolase n=1 Tax=Pseudophaeobacter sp. TaxID=1971739 RepID=UPI0040599B5E
MTPHRRSIKLVIFDCDGVLVESEPIFNRVLHRYLLYCGARISLVECCAEFTGKSRDAVEDYLTAQSLEVPSGWPGDFYDQALAALSQEVTAIEGAVELVQDLRAKGMDFCVASNGVRDKMKVTLARAGLLPFFGEHMFSAYEVGASKPAPDVFLHAARQFGVPPGDCLVVEDSSSGFEAAKRAGMPCLALLPPALLDSPPAALHGAHRITALQEVAQILGPRVQN